MSKRIRFIFSILILLVLNSTFSFTSIVAKLPDLGKPSWVRILDNRLYIVDNYSVKIYSLANFKLEKTFLKEGAGPEEVNSYPRLDVFPNQLVINSFDKLLIFSLNGDFVKEMKTKPFINSIFPIGNNFVATRLDIVQSQKKSVQFISIYDQKLDKIHELFHGDIGGFSIFNSDETGKKNIEMTKDNVEHYVYKDRIYISDTTRGLFFYVFDSNGKKLYEINTPYEKYKVTDEYKEKKLSDKKSSLFYKKYNYTFKEYFPAFNYVSFSDDKIYLLTYPWLINKCELFVMDLKGKILKKTTAPDTYMFAISNDKFYYIKENEEEEEWELYMELIK